MSAFANPGAEKVFVNSFQYPIVRRRLLSFYDALFQLPSPRCFFLSLLLILNIVLHYVA